MANSSIGSGGSSVIDALPHVIVANMTTHFDAWYGDATSNVDLNHDLCVT
jgi:hypothetical protein